MTPTCGAPSCLPALLLLLLAAGCSAEVRVRLAKAIQAAGCTLAFPCRLLDSDGAGACGRRRFQARHPSPCSVLARQAVSRVASLRAAWRCPHAAAAALQHRLDAAGRRRRCAGRPWPDASTASVAEPTKPCAHGHSCRQPCGGTIQSWARINPLWPTLLHCPAAQPRGPRRRALTRC